MSKTFSASNCGFLKRAKKVFNVLAYRVIVAVYNARGEAAAAAEATEGTSQEFKAELKSHLIHGTPLDWTCA